MVSNDRAHLEKNIFKQPVGAGVLKGDLHIVQEYKVGLGLIGHCQAHHRRARECQECEIGFGCCISGDQVKFRTCINKSTQYDFVVGQLDDYAECRLL